MAAIACRLTNPYFKLNFVLPSLEAKDDNESIDVQDSRIDIKQNPEPGTQTQRMNTNPEKVRITPTAAQK
ncbi:unnamed protein product [Dovyalis caffra]|uniref:Uncharacterized protein n=1 Tax=Dovyalis caffra TaxID=77055 RepID=A0AAV1SJ81_9ROSI|nr:unnamed protein product [Dovyalis caffra]